MGNTNLNKAKKTKNDEFYTKTEDIEKEVPLYAEYFENKNILLNCNDGTWSGFWAHFYNNFEKYGLCKISSTTYCPRGRGALYEYDGDKERARGLFSTGDFRDKESIDLLKKSDVVVTNPPFSLFREFIDIMFDYNKLFLVIGNKNALSYKNIFEHFKNNRVWLGQNSVKEFYTSPAMTFLSTLSWPGQKIVEKAYTSLDKHAIQKFGNIGWFTNMYVSKKRAQLIPRLTKTYYGNENLYPFYDNYDAINVDRIKDIPNDYYDVMGVPVTFFDHYNPNEFVIIGKSNLSGGAEGVYKTGSKCLKPTINGKKLYQRVFIKRIC